MDIALDGSWIRERSPLSGAYFASRTIHFFNFFVNLNFFCCSSILERSPFKEAYFASRAILPLCFALFVIVIFVVKQAYIYDTYT